VLHVAPNLFIVKSSADQSFRIEDGIFGIRFWNFGGIADKTLGVGERHIAGSSAISLIICYDLHFSLLPHTHARIRGA